MTILRDSITAECPYGMEMSDCATLETCESAASGAQSSSQTECQPGCMCEDQSLVYYNGTCVEAHNCPCYHTQHDILLPVSGEVLPV